jgi:hypothetical protein
LVTPNFFQGTSRKSSSSSPPASPLRGLHPGGPEAEDTAPGDHEGQAANDRDPTRCGLTRTLHPRKGGSAMAKKAKKTAKKAAKKR